MLYFVCVVTKAGIARFGKGQLQAFGITPMIYNNVFDSHLLYNTKHIFIPHLQCHQKAKIWSKGLNGGLKCMTAKYNKCT